MKRNCIIIVKLEIIIPMIARFLPCTCLFGFVADNPTIPKISVTIGRNGMKNQDPNTADKTADSDT